MRTKGELAGDPELLALYRAHLLAPRLEELRGLVRRAHARGELRRGLAVDLACATIAGPLFLYALAFLAGAKLEFEADLARGLSRAVLGGIARGPHRCEGRASSEGEPTRPLRAARALGPAPTFPGQSRLRRSYRPGEAQGLRRPDTETSRR